MAVVSDGTVTVGTGVATPTVTTPKPTAVAPTVSKAVYKTSPMAVTKSDGSVAINLECCDNKAHSHDNKALLDAIDQAFMDRVASDRVISVVNDNVAHTITFGFKDSADYVIDLSALTTDVYIEDATMANQTLVLTDTNGNDLFVDLSKFLTPDNIVDGTGTSAFSDGSNVHINIKLDPAPDNAMTVTDAGVKVVVPDGDNIYNTDGEITEDRKVTITDKILTFDGGDAPYPVVGVKSTNEKGGSFQVESNKTSAELYAHDNDVGIYNDNNNKTFISYNINDDTVSTGRVFGGNPQYRAKFRVLSELQDYDGHSGTAGQILTPNVDGTGVEWKDAPTTDLTALEDASHTHDNKALLDTINQAFVDRVTSDRVISVTPDNVAHTITFGFKDSADVVVDLGALTTDVHISGASLNNETLVLTDSDGNDITIDMSSFVSTDELDDYLTDIEPWDSSTVDLSTSRVAGVDHTYAVHADVKVSQDDGNTLEVKDDGLYASPDARIFEVTNARFNTLNYNPYVSLGDYDYTGFVEKGMVLTPQASNGSPAGFRAENISSIPPFIVTDNTFNVPQDIEINQGFDMRFKLRGTTPGKEYKVKWYTGFSPYAVDGIEINPQEISKYPHTDTVIAQDLNDGDTEVKIEIQAQTVPYNTGQYIRLFTKQPSGRQQFSDNGFTFSHYGLSRHTGKISAYTDNYDGTATITLTAPWNHGSYLVGDGITNGMESGSYVYTSSTYSVIPRADTGELSDWVSVSSGWKNMSDYLTQDVAQAKMVALFGYAIYEDGVNIPFDADHGFDIADITNIKTKWRNK